MLNENHRNNDEDQSQNDQNDNTAVSESKPINPEYVEPTFYDDKGEEMSEEEAFENIEEKIKEDPQATKGPKIEDQEEPVNEESKDPLDELLEGYHQFTEENQEPEPDPEEEPEKMGPEEEDDFIEPDDPDGKTFDGISIADFISAELVLTYYENLMIKILRIVHKVAKDKRLFDEQKIRVSPEAKEFAAALLDMYWQTIKIKLHPALAAAAFMSITMINNYVASLEPEEQADTRDRVKEEILKKRWEEREKKGHPEINLLSTYAEDVEYVDVEDDKEAA